AVAGVTEIDSRFVDSARCAHQSVPVPWRRRQRQCADPLHVELLARGKFLYAFHGSMMVRNRQTDVAKRDDEASKIPRPTWDGQSREGNSWREKNDGENHNRRNRGAYGKWRVNLTSDHVDDD